MIRKLTEQDYTVSSWSGGKTVQIAIAPEGAAYADREFLWRVSSATVELPESDYTSLPEYYRFITPLSGEMFLSHNGGEETEVEPLEIHEFDGADSTHCRGICTDFNLMLRKGKCEGFMAVLEPDPENSILLNPLEEGQSLVLFAAEGAARLVLPDDTEISFEKGESLWIMGKETEMLLEADEDALVIGAAAEIL